MRRALLTTVVLTACSATDSPTATMIAKLDHTSWTLSTLRGEPVLHSPEATLSFDGDKVVGTGGVNRYFGGWSCDGERVTFTPMGSTRMMGAPDAQRQEDRFLAAFRDVDGARFDGDDLVLTTGVEPVMTFRPR